MKEIFNENFSNKDLYIHNYGEESCKPGHNYGPAIRDFYIIHYIVDGKGVFKCEGKTYILGKGQLFLICPGIISQYTADEIEPWHYMWVGFNGDKVAEYLTFAGLSLKDPVVSLIKCDKLVSCIRDMIDTAENYGLGQEVKFQGLLYVFLSELIESNTQGRVKENVKSMDELYIYRAIRYMSKNYSSDSLSINFLAKYLSLDRSYFSSIFVRKLNITPYQYLMDIRMNKACEILMVTQLAINEIAASVGYKDYIVFSKAFKRKYGCTATEFRMNMI